MPLRNKWRRKPAFCRIYRIEKLSTLPFSSRENNQHDRMRIAEAYDFHQDTNTHKQTEYERHGKINYNHITYAVTVSTSSTYPCTQRKKIIL